MPVMLIQVEKRKKPLSRKKLELAERRYGQVMDFLVKLMYFGSLAKQTKTCVCVLCYLHVGQTFCLFRSSTYEMRATHIRKGNVLY